MQIIYGSRQILISIARWVWIFYTAISRKVVGKKCTRQSGKVLWDMITVSDTVAVEPTFAASL